MGTFFIVFVKNFPHRRKWLFLVGKLLIAFQNSQDSLVGKLFDCWQKQWRLCPIVKIIFLEGLFLTVNKNIKCMIQISLLQQLNFICSSVQCVPILCNSFKVCCKISYFVYISIHFQGLVSNWHGAVDCTYQSWSIMVNSHVTKSRLDHGLPYRYGRHGGATKRLLRG